MKYYSEEEIKRVMEQYTSLNIDALLSLMKPVILPTLESTKTYGDLRAKEALKSIEEKQKRQDEQYAIMAREYEFALNEVIRLQNIVDTGNKEAVKEFAEELIKGMTSDNDPIDIYIKIKRLAKQKGVEI